MKTWSRLVFPALCVAALPALLSCNTAGFGVVSIRPIYGWVDGCTAVSVGWHGFGSDVAVTIGGKPLENVVLPSADNMPLDVGYEVYGTTPMADAAGYAEVKVTTGSDEGTVNGDFYYTACPMGAYPESADPVADVAAGTAVTLSGCSLQSDYLVRVGPANAVPVTSVCKTATVSFSAPAVDTALGTEWYVAIFDASGAQLYPDPSSGCDTTQPYQSQVVTTDTGAIDPCDGVLTLTYANGGA